MRHPKRRTALNAYLRPAQRDGPSTSALLRLMAHDLGEMRAGIDRLVEIFEHNNQCFRHHLEQQQQQVDLFVQAVAMMKTQTRRSDQMVEALANVVQELAFQSEVVPDALRQSMAALAGGQANRRFVQTPKHDRWPEDSPSGCGCPVGGDMLAADPPETYLREEHAMASSEALDAVFPRDTEPVGLAPVVMGAEPCALAEVAQTVESVTCEPLPLVLVKTRSRVKITSSPFKVRVGFNTTIILPRTLWQSAGFTDTDRYRFEREGTAIRITRAEDGLKPKRIGQTSVALQCTTFGDFGDITRTYVQYAPGYGQIVL